MSRVLGGFPPRYQDLTHAEAQRLQVGAYQLVKGAPGGELSVETSNQLVEPRGNKDIIINRSSHLIRHFPRLLNCFKLLGDRHSNLWDI